MSNETGAKVRELIPPGWKVSTYRTGTKIGEVVERGVGIVAEHEGGQVFTTWLSEDLVQPRWRRSCRMGRWCGSPAHFGWNLMRSRGWGSCGLSACRRCASWNAPRADEQQ